MLGISLQEKVTYVDACDRVVEQEVFYEWKPISHAKCAMFRHDEAECRTKPVLKQQWIPKQQVLTQEWQVV